LYVVRPVSEAELFLDSLLVSVHRFRTDVQPLAAFRRRKALCPQAQDVALAISSVAEPSASIVTAMTDPRHALAPRDRDAVFVFAGRLRELRAVEGSEGIATLFGLEEPADVAGTNGGVAFTEPVEADPAAPLRSRHAQFSASSLNTYAECKRKWYYRYLCSAVEDKGSSASFYGTAFHAALEQWHAEFPAPANTSAAILRMRLQGYLNAAFDRYSSGFDTPIELELQRRRARRTASRYVDWVVAQAARAPFTVIGCELPAQLDLEGYDFIGYIDRLDRDDATGNVAVIDYKTGSIARTAQEYREKIRLFQDFQLPFYYWARTAQGDRVTRLALVPLKDALLEVAPVSLEVVPVASEPEKRKSGATGVIPLVELERARTRMVEICRELTEGRVEHFAVTDDPDACRYCAYANACSDRPARLQQRFGR